MEPVKLVLGFVPFLLFTLLTGWLPVDWAAVIGLVAALALVAVTAQGGTVRCSCRSTGGSASRGATSY